MVPVDDSCLLFYQNVRDIQENVKYGLTVYF